MTRRTSAVRMDKSDLKVISDYLRALKDCPLPKGVGRRHLNVVTYSLSKCLKETGRGAVCIPPRLVSQALEILAKTLALGTGKGGQVRGYLKKTTWNQAMSSLGITIKRIRIKRGLSQREVARRARISPTYLSLIENSRRIPSGILLRRIARALRIPYEVILWQATEVPKRLPTEERKVWQAAKRIARNYYEQTKA